MSSPAPGRPGPIDVKTRFERFPLAVKGAFVLRGADGNPHSVRLVEAALARLPGGERHPFAVEDRLIDVAPNRDLFVPFEASVTEVRSGWYVIRSSVEVDGAGPLSFRSKPFTIPWARTDVRRGTVPIDRSISVDGAVVRVVRVEMGADAATVIWRPEAEGRPAPTVSLVADGRALEVLPADAGAPQRPPAGLEERLRTYPVPRATRALEVVVRAGRGTPASVPVSLA
jgi:hypothetical protein